MREQDLQRHEWLTVKEYAILKRVNEETVRRWLRSGKLEADRTCGPLGHWRIRAPQSTAA